MARAAAAALGAVVALALPGCARNAEPAPLAEADSTGGKPQLALTTTCYARCADSTPLALPELALYSSGRLVAVARTGPDARPVLRTAQLDSATLAGLQRRALDAGLSSGDYGTLPRTSRFPAGSGTVFTVRLRSTTTVLEVPLLDSGQPDSASYADPARHGKLLELATALREVAGRADKPLAETGYVVHARPAAPRGSVQAWRGPRLASLPRLTGALRCGIVRGPEQALVAGAVDTDPTAGRYRDGGRTWSVVARPLLPHEESCGDVQETVQSATTTGPRFPGDTRR